MQTVDEYLQKTLSKAKYDNLATELEMPKSRLTRRLMKPEYFTYEELLKLSEVLPSKIKIALLVDRSNAGIDRLTVRQYRLLKKA
ncbi:hypothetical protein [Aureispira anguillae]|uniref:Uncharacterized protein n=1 Tax=Aureispira anguillae TaxID=2864201 RepID=A0A915YGV1_9BACT|nr:hypothetical protein [Aureispira anguillae]BDS12769.1 hypothetical protein AsAng_0034940 [Aureispira anguillae]